MAEEIIDIFTKDGTKIGKMPKKDYYIKTLNEDCGYIKTVTGFIVTEDGKILVEKRSNKPGTLDQGKLDLCSGHVRTGELPTEAMLRESFEELGITSANISSILELGKINVDFSKFGNFFIKYLSTSYAIFIKDKSKVKKDGDEVESFTYLDYNTLVQAIRFGKTRFPYNEKDKEEMENIFRKLNEVIKSRNIDDLQK